MKKILATATALAVLSSGFALADTPREVKARQGQFQILALNLGVLGGMAKGAVEYDADAAQAAADSIVGIAMVNQGLLFKEGTDSESVEGTRALPAIWEDMDGFSGKWAMLAEGAAAMQAAAATGKDAIGPNLGKIGASCKGCHDTYRAPQ